MHLPWPKTFSPYLGTEDVGTPPLPRGPYYILVYACPQPHCANVLNQGTRPGGPFTLVN